MREAERLISQPGQADATEFDRSLEGKADVVLADVPCSGYGVIGRKPDIKYRASAQSQRELVRLQRRILENAAAYVKPGGILVYSTCTIGREENQVTRGCCPASRSGWKVWNPICAWERREVRRREGYRSSCRAFISVTVFSWPG